MKGQEPAGKGPLRGGGRRPREPGIDNSPSRREAGVVAWEPLDARPLGGTAHARWVVPALASPGHGSAAAVAAFSPGHWILSGFCDRQREVTTWRILSKPCVPPSPASLSGLPFSSRPLGPPAFSLRSSLASQAPPSLQGPPHISTGDLRRLWPRRHEETPGLTPAADGAARNGRGFLASSVAETPELQ